MSEAAVKAWEQAGEYFDFEGKRIFFRQAGQGETLLLIHGFPTSSWDWVGVWEQLISRYRVIALDMLGFGFSDKPVGHDYSLTEQAEIHQRLLMHLGVANCDVLAHDYGVSVAQELLARQEEGSLLMKIQSIAFLNGGLFPETHRARTIQKLLLGPLGPVLSGLMGYRQFAKSFSAVFGPDTQPSEEELQDFWGLMTRQNGHRQLHRLMRYILDRRENRERWLTPMQSTQIPMRVINGPVDPVSGAHMVARYCELISNPDCVSLPGVGHYPQVEDPEGVLKAYLEFVER